MARAGSRLRRRPRSPMSDFGPEPYSMTCERHPIWHKRAFLALVLLFTPAAGALTIGSAGAQSREPVLMGVSGPLTGPAAQYGAQWKKGFDLAIDEVNGAGGINGR